MRTALALLFALLPLTAEASHLTVVGSLTRASDVAPGEHVEGEIVVRNNGDSHTSVLLSQTDYSFTADGANDFGAPGALPRSNARWIHFTPQQATIPPGETARFAYTVDVPQDPALSGTYWSTIMVSPTIDRTYAKREQDKAVVSVNTVFRYAVQMVSTVGEADADVRFLDRRVVAAEDGDRFEIDVENVGDLWLDPTLWTELYDADGRSLGRFQGRKARLFPGCSARYGVDLSRVPPGRYTALVVLDNGDEHVFGTQVALELP